MSETLSDDDLTRWKRKQDFLAHEVYTKVNSIPKLYEDITYFSNNHNITVNHLLYRMKQEFETVEVGFDRDAILVWQMIQMNDYGVPVEIEHFEEWQLLAFDVERTFDPQIPSTQTDPTILTAWLQTNYAASQQILTAIQESPDLRTQIEEHTQRRTILDNIFHTFSWLPGSLKTTTYAWTVVKSTINRQRSRIHLPSKSTPITVNPSTVHAAFIHNLLLRLESI